MAYVACFKKAQRGAFARAAIKDRNRDIERRGPPRFARVPQKQGTGWRWAIHERNPVRAAIF